MPPGEVIQTESRLRAWTPTMKEYHADPSISAGFLESFKAVGLREALRRRGAEPTRKPELVRGAIVHAAMTGEGLRLAHRGGVEARERAAAWGHVPAPEFDVAVGEADWSVCMRSALSLNAADTPAKRQVLSILDWERWPEVSHRWNPPEVPGLSCRIREDMVVRSASGRWAAIQIKTGARPLRYLYRQRWRLYGVGRAFYLHGLRDLFGDAPFNMLLILASLAEPGFSWGVYDLTAELARLDSLWYDRLVPDLTEIHEAVLAGRMYSREEAGIFQ